jgi:hypothetical protein
MSEQQAPTPTAGPWALRQLGRLFLSAVAGAAVGLAATVTPGETRVIIGLDVFLVTLVALTYVMMSVTTVDQCVLMAKQR